MKVERLGFLDKTFDPEEENISCFMQGSCQLSNHSTYLSLPVTFLKLSAYKISFGLNLVPKPSIFFKHKLRGGFFNVGFGVGGDCSFRFSS